MLFIMGICPKTVILKQGTFQCPICRTNNPYQLTQQRNYFSLFFIRLIPLSKLGNAQVQCLHCKTAMPPSVLGHH